MCSSQPCELASSKDTPKRQGTSTRHIVSLVSHRKEPPPDKNSSLHKAEEMPSLDRDVQAFLCVEFSTKIRPSGRRQAAFYELYEVVVLCKLIALELVLLAAKPHVVNAKRNVLHDDYLDPVDIDLFLLAAI